MASAKDIVKRISDEEIEWVDLRFMISDALAMVVFSLK